jgi:phage RecT family recombinase
MAENNIPATAGQKALPMEQVFKSQLTLYEGTIVKLISDTGIKPDKFLEIVYTSVRKNPELLKCDRASLFGSILTAAEYGLAPNTPFGYCYIIPYDDKKTGLKLAQFQFGYQGLTQLMYRVPGVKNISTERVFSKDISTGGFEYEIFPVKKITKHKPYIPRDEKDSRGTLVATYCVITMEGLSEPLFEIAFKDDLDAIQKISKAGNSNFSPYNAGTDVFNWMQRKVPVKQIFKMMRKETSPLASKAFELEDIIDRGGIIKSDENGNTTITFMEGFGQPKKASSLTQSLHNRAKDIQPEPELEKKPEPVVDPLNIDAPPVTEQSKKIDANTNFDNEGQPRLL